MARTWVIALPLLACAIGCGPKVQVTVRVALPPSTPISDTITIAGNLSEFGSWDPGRVGLVRDMGMTASRTFEVPRGAEVEFKLTRGSWDTEAMYRPDGSTPPNTAFRADHDTTVELVPLGWKDSMPKGPGSLTGRFDVYPAMTGDGLRSARSVTVRVPPSYRSQTSRRYPVLYMHDGQNCMDRTRAAFGSEWRADEIMDSLASVGAIEEVIIVAIDNASDRIDEYSDTPMGSAYMDFVAHTVKPLVDSLYRTRPEPEHTAVMGSSMGGLISFLMAWEHPEVFGKAACLSSIFDRHRTEVLPIVERTPAGSPRQRLYMDCGGAPGEVSLKPGLDEMVQILKQRGFQEGRDLQWYFDPVAIHHESAWSSRLWRPMTFLFPRVPVPSSNP